MEYLRIGLDLDEVVFNYVDPFLDWYNKKYGKSWSRADLKTYSFEESGILPKGSNNAFIKEFVQTKDYWELPLMPDAQDAIQDLGDEYDIVFITSRGVNGIPAAHELLRENSLDYGPILHSTKDLTKGQICKELGLYAFVDDMPMYLEEIRIASPATQTFLLSNIQGCIDACGCDGYARNWKDMRRLLLA